LPVPQLPLRGLSLDGDLRDEQEEYAENVYIYHLINAATVLGKGVGSGHAAIQDITVGFGVDRPRLNIVCTEAPGVMVYTDSAAEDEGDLDSVLDGNYGARTLDHNERIHYGSLPSAQRPYAPTGSTAGSTAVHSKFETLANTICDQQDALEAAHRRYDEHVALSSTQLAQLMRSHEARMAS
jgi:hypothetical protein